MLPQVGKKLYEDSEICHFNTVSRVQGLQRGWGAGIGLQSKRHITASSIVCYKEGSTVINNILGFWKQHILHLNIVLVHILVIWKTTSFKWGPEEKRALYPVQYRDLSCLGHKLQRIYEGQVVSW